MKKAKKVKKQAKVIEPLPEPVKAPPKPEVVIPTVQPGLVDIQVTKDELNAIINLITFSKDAFTHLAEDALKREDKESLAKFVMRAKVSETLATRLATIAEIGEPTNRNVH